MKVGNGLINFNCGQNLDYISAPLEILKQFEAVRSNENDVITLLYTYCIILRFIHIVYYITHAHGFAEPKHYSGILCLPETIDWALKTVPTYKSRLRIVYFCFRKTTFI